MKKALPLIAITALFCTTAIANTPEIKKFSELDFNTIDINQNGLISTDEAAGNITLINAFPSIDLDGNQALNKKEYNLYLTALGKKSS